MFPTLFFLFHKETQKQKQNKKSSNHFVPSLYTTAFAHAVQHSMTQWRPLSALPDFN